MLVRFQRRYWELRLEHQYAMSLPATRSIFLRNVVETR